MRSYVASIHNVSSGQYFANNFVSFSAEESEEGDLKGVLELPKNLEVTNAQNRYVVEPGLLREPAGKLITNDAASLKLADKSTLVLEKKETINGQNYVRFTAIDKPAEVIADPVELKLQRVLKTNSPNPPGTNQTVDVTRNIYNYIAVGDRLRITVEFFEFGLKRFTKTYNVYTRQVEIGESTVKIAFRGYNWQFNRTTIQISTMPLTNTMLKMLKGYVFWYILKYSDVNSILVLEQDYNTFNNSNIGTYRSGTITLFTFLQNLTKDYNINFLTWPGDGSIYVTYGNSLLTPYYPNNPGADFTPFEGGTREEGRFIKYYTYLGVTEVGLKRVYGNDNPILIRATSVNSQLDLTKNRVTRDNKNKAEVVYGDPDAPAGGTVIQFNTTNLSQAALEEFAIKQYVKKKYLSVNNTLALKEPILHRSILFLYDYKEPYMVGYLYVTSVTHELSVNGGYMCKLTTGMKFDELGNLADKLSS